MLSNGTPTKTRPPGPWKLTAAHFQWIAHPDESKSLPPLPPNLYHVKGKPKAKQRVKASKLPAYRRTGASYKARSRVRSEGGSP